MREFKLLYSWKGKANLDWNPDVFTNYRLGRKETVQLNLLTWKFTCDTDKRKSPRILGHVLVHIHYPRGTLLYSDFSAWFEVHSSRRKWMSLLALLSVWYKLVSPRKREPLWRTYLYQVGLEVKSMEKFLDVGGPRSLWAVLPLDRSSQEV